MVEKQMGLFGGIEQAQEDPVNVTKKNKYQEGKLYLVNLAEIADNPFLSRSQLDDENFAALVESLKHNGVLQPIVCIIDVNGGLMLAAGNRRFTAAKLIGLKKIPTWVIKGDHAEISLIENVQRENLTAVEEAEALSAIKSRKCYQLDDLAALRGKAVSTVSEILAVASLPKEILDDCRSSKDMPRDILVHISRLASEGEKISFYRDYKSGLRSRKDIKDFKRRLMPKSRRPYEFISGFSAKIKKLDIDKMVPDQCDCIKSKLENLLTEINETLIKLKTKL
jgi:ParB family chromosome partitioning protein